MLPKYWHVLPKDQGRAHAVNAEMSIGKPMGAGAIFVPIFAFVALLVVPLQWPYLTVIACMVVAMYVGYLDDKTRGGWSEYALGACDLVVSIVAAMAVCHMAGSDVWLPFLKAPLHVEPWLFISAGSILIWVTINSTNATDGVDGLSGSLSAMALVFLGAILYGVVGHKDVSAYLLLPHYAERSRVGDAGVFDDRLSRELSLVQLQPEHRADGRCRFAPHRTCCWACWCLRAAIRFSCSSSRRSCSSTAEPAC